MPRARTSPLCRPRGCATRPVVGGGDVPFNVRCVPSADDDTWEPAENINGELVEAFEAREAERAAASGKGQLAAPKAAKRFVVR